MELQEQVTQLHDVWKQAFEIARASPASWQPYLPNASLVVVDEAVGTLSHWISRARTPSGFSPAFHLAKSVATTSVPSLMATAQQLAAGQYAQLPNFVNGLISLLGAMHTMAVFSDKTSRDLHALPEDLSALLSQSLSLLETAQVELKEKADQLDGVQNLAGEITESHASVEDTKTRADAALKTIEELRNGAIEALAAASESATQANDLRKQVKELTEETAELKGKLSAITTSASEIQETSVTQQELIASILPKAASAGLAAAFASRAEATNVSKWVWMVVFVLTLAGLGWFAHDLLAVKVTTGELGAFLLLRVTLAAPLVWLGWFAAVQYGNIVRVQEDYAFKEATSKAFQGYRDHLEHLASVSSAEGGNAMNQLALATIEILAREPLRIYKGTHHDASPMQTAASAWAQFRGKGKEGPEQKE